MNRVRLLATVLWFYMNPWYTMPPIPAPIPNPDIRSHTEQGDVPVEPPVSPPAPCANC